MSTEDPTADIRILTALLRHFDWNPRGGVPGRYEVWENDRVDDSVIVPMSPDSGDFDALLIAAQRWLLSLEGPEATTLYELLQMTQEAELDSTQWKQETAIDAGLIGWLDGERLFAAAKDSLVAAAKATAQKKRYFGNAQSYVSKQFLENALMGQTEVGSFIVTAHVPALRRFHVTKRSENAAAHNARPAESQTISGREVLGTFENALDAVQVGIARYRKNPDPSSFLDLVSEGVSHEMTRALSVLTEHGDAAVSIKHFDEPSVRASREYVFDAVDSSVLQRASVALVQEAPSEHKRLRGEVSLLENESRNSIHLVRLNTIVDGNRRKVRVRLTPQQYETAIDAHRLGMDLEVGGRLELEGKNFWLYEPTSVTVIAKPLQASSKTETFQLEDIPLGLEGPS